MTNSVSISVELSSNTGNNMEQNRGTHHFKSLFPRSFSIFTVTFLQKVFLCSAELHFILSVAPYREGWNVEVQRGTFLVTKWNNFVREIVDFITLCCLLQY